MSKKKLLDALVKHHQDVKELFQVSDELEEEVFELTKKTLHSQAFENHFKDKSSDSYNDFDREVLSLIKKLLQVSNQKKIIDAYKKSLESHQQVIESLDRVS